MESANDLTKEFSIQYLTLLLLILNTHVRVAPFSPDVVFQVALELPVFGSSSTDPDDEVNVTKL